MQYKSNCKNTILTIFLRNQYCFNPIWEASKQPIHTGTVISHILKPICHNYNVQSQYFKYTYFFTWPQIHNQKQRNVRNFHQIPYFSRRFVDKLLKIDMRAHFRPYTKWTHTSNLIFIATIVKSALSILRTAKVMSRFPW